MRAGSYRPAIDWLKAAGILLILLGHLAGGYTNHLSPPIYPKQIGVALFVFALGYSLALETRPRRVVVFNRLFEVFLWGLVTAALVTLETYLANGRLALSNYLPFLMGSNVLVNDFPANPTTWYIGTYLHLLLLWCVVHRLRITWTVLAITLSMEITARYLLLAHAGNFIAYMALPNWITVLAAGIWASQANWSPRHHGMLVLGVSIIFGFATYSAIWPVIGEQSFPFMFIASPSPHVAVLATSCLASLLYVGWAVLTYQLAWRSQPPSWVRFIARNTLLVFIAHMPLFYLLDPWLQGLGLSYGYRSLIELLACLPGLALVSEVAHRVVPITRWRDASRDELFMKPAQDGLSR